MQKISNPSTSITPPKILKKFHNIPISTQTKLSHQVKTNSRTIIKFHIGYFNNSSSRASKDSGKLLRMKILPKIASLLQQEKLVSSLVCSFVPTTPSGIIFLTSKLKHLKNITSLNLDSFQFCTPQFLKYPSIILSQLKKLTSLTLRILSKIDTIPQHITSLFFALRRLNNFTSFSLTMDGTRLNDESSQALSRCLSKLTHLKDLTLSLKNVRNPNPPLLSLLASAFKKLTLLQKITLSVAGSIKDQTILDFFTSIQDLKSLNNLALDLSSCMLFPTNCDPISKGLSLLDPNLLETFSFTSSFRQDDGSLNELGAVLRIFPSLQKLTLDIAAARSISNTGLYQLAANLRALPKLSYLHLKFFSPNKFCRLVDIISITIKYLVNLKSLNLDFTGPHASYDVELCQFSKSLQRLTALRSLSLKFGELAGITDDGFIAFSTVLKDLTELSVLNLDVSYLRTLTNKSIMSLSSAIESLKKLTDLSINCFGNPNIDKESIENLGQALKSLAFLSSIDLNFSSCYLLKSGEDIFIEVFKALDEMKLLRKICMIMPSHKNTYELYARYVLHKIILWGPL